MTFLCGGSPQTPPLDMGISPSSLEKSLRLQKGFCLSPVHLQSGEKSGVPERLLSFTCSSPVWRNVWGSRKAFVFLLFISSLERSLGFQKGFCLSPAHLQSGEKSGVPERLLSFSCSSPVWRNVWGSRKAFVFLLFIKKTYIHIET